MKLGEINPYLRFVRRISYIPTKEYLCAYDCHFYYFLSEDAALIAGGKEYSLGKGSIVILPPGVKCLLSSEGCLDIISINFDYTQNHSHLEKEFLPVNCRDFRESDILEKASFENYELFSHRPPVAENMSCILPDIDRIIMEHTYKKQFYSEISSSIFKSLLFEIIRLVACDGTGFFGVDLILDYIHSHYYEEINNKTLSSLAGYHPYHLNRLMKKATGTTLRQYLIEYRIECAKRFLRDGEHPISKICELCGYKNFSNFSADFKKKTGISPKEYRNISRNLV